MKRTFEKDNVTFEVVSQGTNKALDIQRTANRWCRRWEVVYKRPSQEKVNIKDYWERIIKDWGGEIYGYTGNTFTFSIYATIPVFNEDKYIQITPTHNRIVL